MSLKIAIPYFSASGHTQKIAITLSNYLRNLPLCDVALIDVTLVNKSDWQFLHQSDVIIFGSPTFMGSVAAEFKKFMDESANFWLDQSWKDKIAAAFTVGSSQSGDKLNSLVQLSIFAAQHGMIWVGFDHVGSRHKKDGKKINHNGCWLGLMVQSSSDKSKLIEDHDLLSAELFAQRLADIALRIKD